MPVRRRAPRPAVILPARRSAIRILTFLHSFEPGGVERVALRLITRWRALGADAPLFMGRADGPLRTEVAADLTFAVPAQPRIGTAWWETLWMIATLPRHIRRTTPDVLFCAGSTYTIVAVAMKLILRGACPPIVTKISNDLARADLPWPARRVWHLWLRILARFIDHWIVMDAAILADVDRHLGAVGRTVVHDPAIDALPPPAPPRAATPGTRYVAVGRMVAQKDHATMLAAFAVAAGPDDRLTLLGDGPLRARLERQAAALGIAARVRFAGHVANAAALLPEHDVLLLSSRYEGVPAVLIEALATGIRIVATDCGPGVRSVLGDGRLARLVPPGDRAAFADAIAAARTMTVDRDAARRQAQSFTLDVVAPLYLAAIGEAARR